MILYSGKGRTGLVSKVKNEVDGRVYNISTAESRGSWGTLVFPSGVWGTLLGSFKPIIAIQSHSEKAAGMIHHEIEYFVDQRARATWPKRITVEQLLALGIGEHVSAR